MPRLLALASDAMALTDGDGVIEWVNARFAELTGHDESTALGAPLLDLLNSHQTDAPVQQLLHAALRSQSALEGIELCHRKSSGEAFWNRVAVHPIGGAKFAFVMRDIGAERASEREQRRLAELLELALQVGRLGVWERDIPSGKERWDREVFRLYGLEANEGTPDFEIAMQRVHPEDRVRAIYEESTRRAGQYSCRYRIVLPDARVRRVHSVWRVANSPAGLPDRALGILVDDTESAQLAESFNEASAQLQLAVELGDIAIWRHDLKTDRMHYSRKAYEVLAIAPRPEGLPLAEVRALIHPDDLPRVIESARVALQNVRPTDMEARYRRADGCLSLIHI